MKCLLDRGITPTFPGQDDCGLACAANIRAAREPLASFRQLLRAELGLDGQDLTEEAEAATERWAEDAEMEVQPPTTPLQRLLKERYELGEQILDLQEKR
jgi:hypothetical protein